VPAIQSEMGKKEVYVDWFATDKEIRAELHEIVVELVGKAVTMKNEYMTKPASEQRAYGNDEPRYRARARKIREKGFNKGWKRSKAGSNTP
jgi:hypothetical protein